VAFRAFVVPADRVFVEEFGVAPVAVEDAETASQFEVAVGEDVLDFTYDVLGRSIRCLWSRGDTLLLDIFREGATHLMVYTTPGETHLRTEFETDSLRGYLDIQVFPTLGFEDSLLLV
jgi:hypothetical protein